MSDTARLHPDVASFAASVRARLSDLDAEEIEELTGEMESDLQERFDETGAAFGDPGAYAAELRAAAGLPRRELRTDRYWYTALGAAMSRRRATFVEWLRANPAAAAVLDFLSVFRPLWWLARAWVAYEIAHLLIATNSVGTWLPDSALGWAVLLAAGLVSVQWGRGEWLVWPRLRRVVVIGNVAAVVLAPFAYSHAAGPSAFRPTSSIAVINNGPSSPEGLSMNGHAVRNVFAYDAQGNPLSNVQLYDHEGKPLFVGKRQTWNWVSVPATVGTGQQAWNVFPLDRVRWGESTFDRASNRRVPEPGVTPEAAPRPLPRAPALLPTPPDEGDGDQRGDADPKADEPGGETPTQ
ncbi:MAG: hypothetical protein ACRDO7_04945 [Nocardioidaceae bacterium]